MFKFTDEQKAYIIEQMDKQVEKAEKTLAEMKSNFARLQANIDTLSNSELFALLSVSVIFSSDEDKPLMWSGLNNNELN